MRLGNRYIHVRIVDTLGTATGCLIALPAIYLRTIGYWIGTYTSGGYHADKRDAELLLKLPGAFITKA